MNAKTHKRFRRRISIIGAGFTLALALILAKSVQLQVMERSFLSGRAASNYKKVMVTQGKRGTIYDAAHREMAVAVEVTAIGLHPAKVKKSAQVVNGLAKAVGISTNTLKSKLSSDAPFVWLERQATPKQITAVTAVVKDHALKGVVFEPAQGRYYPHKTLAGQVLGFTGIDSQGLEGVEFHHNAHLRGHEGKMTVLRDRMGRGFELEHQLTDETAGNNVILTIDAHIQRIAEQALATTVQEYDAKSGMALVMDPKTGAIRAMALYPFFDPNTFGRYSRFHWRNRLITDTFEPGSTLKIFTAAAAIEARAVSDRSVYFCENGRYHIGRIPIHDTHEYEWLTVSEIVKYSSNIGAAKILQTMGRDVFYRQLKKFGFGDLTGIDCPGEVDGRLVHYRLWRPIDAANLAFGQGIAVTAMQLATAVAAIANDGLMMRPHIVQAVTAPNGRLLQKTVAQPIRRAISAGTARAIRQMMAGVVQEGGTGTRAAINGYAVGGKTGTAQKIGPDGRYSRSDFVSSFVGFAPFDVPKTVVLVVVDEPRKRHYGGTVAAPAFKKIAQDTLGYLNVPPSLPKPRLDAAKPLIKKARL
jgi:cell division protein FtsI (penicillin-binding protein 3)